MSVYKVSGFDDIYETVIGMREKEYCVPFVEDVFAEGKLCDQRYEEMRHAYARICQRLGVGDEDEDLNIIVRCMEEIQKEIARDLYKLSIQMSEYAVAESMKYEELYRKISTIV